MQICRGSEEASLVGEASVRLCWKVQGILGTAQYQMSPVAVLLGVSVEKSWLMGQQRSKDSTQTLQNTVKILGFNLKWDLVQVLFTWIYFWLLCQFVVILWFSVFSCWEVINYLYIPFLNSCYIFNLTTFLNNNFSYKIIQIKHFEAIKWTDGGFQTM